MSLTHICTLCHTTPLLCQSTTACQKSEVHHDDLLAQQRPGNVIIVLAKLHTIACKGI